MFFHKHNWWVLKGIDFDGVYLLWSRPVGKAKLQYCINCGQIRFVGLDKKGENERD